MGLINRVLPQHQLESGLEALLDELRGKSSAVMRLALKGLRELSFKTFSDDFSGPKRSTETSFCELKMRQRGFKRFYRSASPVG